MDVTHKSLARKRQVAIALTATFFSIFSFTFASSTLSLSSSSFLCCSITVSIVHRDQFARAGQTTSCSNRCAPPCVCFPFYVPFYQTGIGEYVFGFKISIMINRITAIFEFSPENSFHPRERDGLGGGERLFKKINY